MPRRIRSARSRSRARASRLRTVPTGQPNLERPARGSAFGGNRHNRCGGFPGKPIDLVPDVDLEPRRMLRPHAPAISLSPTGDEPGRSGTGRDPAGHPVQPTGQRFPLSDRARLANQDQERRLKSVLGIVRVPQDPRRQTEDHRPVPLDQHRERRLGPRVAGPRNRSSSCPSVRPTAVPVRKSRLIGCTVNLNPDPIDTPNRLPALSIVPWGGVFQSPE